MYQALRAAFPAMECVSAVEMTYRVRSIKDQDEMALITKACSFLSKGMSAAVEAVRPGVSETEVLAEADYAMRKAGSEGSSFRMQVLTPKKQLLVHPYADASLIGNDQVVVVHLGASCGGYVGKMCRTVALGEPAQETLDIHELLRQAQDLAVGALLPGTCVADIYTEVAAFVAEAGYGGQFLDHLGYGVGIRQSEFYPVVGKDLPHVIEKDMVVDLLLPTIYKPGVGGPRITDVIRVLDDGGEYLTTFPRELVRK